MGTSWTVAHGMSFEPPAPFIACFIICRVETAPQDLESGCICAGDFHCMNKLCWLQARIREGGTHEVHHLRLWSSIGG